MTPDGSDSVQDHLFTLTSNSINGQPMAMDRIDLTVVKGTVETSVRIGDGMPHNFHVHDAQFGVLTMDGAPPPPALTGPKDTIFLPPNTAA